MWMSFWIGLLCLAFVAFSLMLVLVGFGAIRELREMLAELRTHSKKDMDDTMK